MGLDMYLTAKKYVSDYDNAGFSSKMYEVTKEFNNGWDPIYVEFEAIYWRKANQIHNWFVKNIQDGVDDCKQYWVDFDQLKELYDTVVKVLSDHSLAETLLPSNSGFFFGSTDYDEYYYRHLEYTRDKLKIILDLDDPHQFTFYYHSSW